MDSVYYQALGFCQKSTREDGIDAALKYNDQQLSGLLVPSDVGQTYQIAAQAGDVYCLCGLILALTVFITLGYPMITLPAGISQLTGMPYGLGLMNTAFSEPTLIKFASAIEDLQVASRTSLKRTLPLWYGFLERNIPVLNI